MDIPMEPARQERAELTRKVAAFLDEWLEGARYLDAWGIDLSADTLESLRQAPPEGPGEMGDLLDRLEVANRPGIYHPSGGHLSYIPNAGSYTAALGEFLAAGLNRFTGVTEAAPGMVAIEQGVIDWLASLFRLGPESAGVLLSGGSMANFTAIVAARTSILGEEFSDGVVYVTEHTHHSIAKAARLAGLRSERVVDIPVDGQLRMDPEALVRQVGLDRGRGLIPLMVVGSAGTTDTGTVDELEAIADVAEAEGLWLHVDAAYGGFFQLTERGERRLEGIDRAASITLDPHKGLSIPFGVGALLVADESALVDAHEGRGAYLRDDDSYMGLRDFASLGPELSRPFRGLSVWLPLHLHGVGAFRTALDRSLDLAEHAYDRLSGIEGVDSPWAPDLSVVAFKFADEELGRHALETVNSDRTVHLSATTVAGEFVLRFAILNRRTTAEHIDHAIDLIEKTLIG